VDEAGYVPFSNAAAQLLFGVSANATNGSEAVMNRLRTEESIEHLLSFLWAPKEPPCLVFRGLNSSDEMVFARVSNKSGELKWEPPLSQHAGPSLTRASAYP
jgi:hypothetical protein